MAVIRLKDIYRMQRWNRHKVNNRWDNIIKSGVLIDGSIRLGPFDGIKDCWKDQPVFVIGGGPSAKDIDFKLLENKNTIVLNHMIELWDKCKWFLFMDRRFFRITTYNLNNFEGKIFAHTNTQLNTIDKKENIILFYAKTFSEKPTMKIEEGLYCRGMSGLAALNLGLITGGNPIYMVGLDTPKDWDWKDGAHYTREYNGEDKNTDKTMKGYISRYFWYEKFKPFRDKIINVCPNGYIIHFPTISVKDFNKMIKFMDKVK